MLRFSANISTMFTEVDFIERFEKAAAAGFKAVEIQFPYEWEARQLAEKLNQYELELVLHNLSPGRFADGERGIAILPDRVDDFRKSVDQAVQYAKTLDCTCLNCLVGLVPTDFPPEKFRRTLVENLRFAAEFLENESIQLVIEMLNDRDVPGFYLNCTKDALNLIEEVNHRNIKMQYDIYHMQIMEGDLTRTIRNHIDLIGHIQLADNPGRHQPGTGEINFDNLFKSIEDAGYSGWLGCEYFPLGKTEDTLAFLEPFRQGG